MTREDPERSGLQGFLGKIKRRRVVRVAVIYGAAAFAGLQAADLVLSALGAPEWLMSLMVITAIVGFPIAVVISWVFDITPQGIRRTRADASGPPPTWFSGGSLAVLGGIALALAAGWWLTSATSGVGTGTARPDGIRSIAVLPFDNLGELSEDEYFADGLADELRSLLARISGLDVAARASSFQVRELAGDVPTVTSRLGVGAVLRGTVLKSAERIRVNAELLSAESGGLQLWSAEYDRLVDDVFVVQSEIASAIVDAIGMRLPQDEATPMDEVLQTNAMAYDKYLWGQFNANRGTPAGARDAIDNFGMSIGFDSAYAPAWTGLAESHAQELELSVAAEVEAALGSGFEAVERAVELDPNSVDARVALAWFRYQSFDWNGADRELREALARDLSSSMALVRHAELLTAMGRHEQAVSRIRAAIRVDGLSPRVRRTAARVLAGAGLLTEAIAQAQEALQLDADDVGTWSDIGFLFLAAGRFEDAPDAFQRLAELTSADSEAASELVAAAETHLTSGARGRFPAGVELLARDRSGTEALFHAAVGDVDAALASLAAAVELRDHDLATLVRLPMLEAVRRAPGFEVLASRMRIQG